MARWRIGMIPVFAVARLPAAMRYDEDRYARRLDCGVERPQVVEQANLGGDLLHPRPDLPALRQVFVMGSISR